MSSVLERILDSSDPIEPDEDLGVEDKTAEGTGDNEPDAGKEDEGGTEESDSTDGDTGDSGTGDSGGDTDVESDGDADGETSGESDEDTDTDDSDSDSDTVSEELKKLKDAQEELKQVLRITRRENATLKAKLGRIDKSLADSSKDEFDDEEDGDKAGPELSNLEILQQQLEIIGQKRGAQLELLADQMAEMQKYSDIYEVCSKQNVGEVVEAAAKIIQQEHGGDVNEIMLELEVDVWSRPNPYKYLYGLIKEHHPKYVESEKKAPKKESKPSVEKALGKKSASSIQDMGGSGDKVSRNTWTADKIDKLPEDELSKVPDNVYEKYLAGELD
jgi:hypothetical protein